MEDRCTDFHVLLLLLLTQAPANYHQLARSTRAGTGGLLVSIGRDQVSVYSLLCLHQHFSDFGKRVEKTGED